MLNTNRINRVNIFSVILIFVGLLFVTTGNSQVKKATEFLISKASASGTGGPIVLDGMDPVCHASMGENTDGYIRKVIKSIYDRSNGPSNNRIAIVGAASSTSAACGGNWTTLLPNKFLTEFGTSASGLQPQVDFYSTSEEITAFFSTTISAAPPRMIWIPDNFGRSTESIFTTNAEKIADFVNSGGGLFSNMGQYGWLTALLPGAVYNNGGCNGGPEATADGATDFGLSNSIVAACWHGYFTGNVGTLKTLVDWPYPTGSTRKAVSIGGGSVSLPSSFTLSASPTNPEAGQPLTITATAQTLAGVAQAGVTVSMTVSSGPDAGQTFTATTNASGVATFTINTSSVGSNTYTATATVNGVLKTVSVTTVWAPPATTTAAPTTTTATTVAPTTSAAPSTTSAPALIVPLYTVSLDINGGTCLVDALVENATVSASYLGYRYIPGPAECERDGFSLAGWAIRGTTVSANLPLIIDPNGDVWRYFISADLDLVAIWSEHSVPETTVPSAEAPTTTVHDHSSHDHGDLPVTGSSSNSSMIVIGIFLMLAGLVLLTVNRLQKQVTR